ncbi:hypothetical protein [Aquamicrobium sp. LC103]|uniref:hypothetical protein n=1 Tax=Aquamicrobium sp. LC103 TaxID=1120658 RepID=UPI00063EA779|nr:hypothetical protein [Aquamicrobium sp. LC103]TKT80406.1 hypothetical protein XW59_008730 [Aquamicrobium sp. LC103]
MKPPVIALLAFGIATPALAEWRLDNGVAIVAPAATNSTMELLAISCGDPYLVEVYSRGGPVRPAEGDHPAKYFHIPGRIEARIDGRTFPLVAAGSGAAAVLFFPGSEMQNGMASVSDDFIETLKAGKNLSLVFDVTPERNEADGSAFETMAEFPLESSAAALDTALAPCRHSASR